MIPGFVLDKQKDAIARLETALVALREDGPTPLVEAIANDAIRQSEDAQALHDEWVDE